ncbi:DUF4232 domain-containing protein [Streptomyces sp. FH025]|uniref:DUF4232 domain-containing protein n=1 Tax=Streptomyces sp. FH025 TaxID=2815937 RepID=UPI001A9F2BD2|nr:DUF4232 domain-containing protein [Streptomyces sp. FH025]MBO1420413.1 DUF4232 domain-containing protein [Streptomyces sp. FH025]
MSVRRALFVPAVLAGALLSLTACQPGSGAEESQPATRSAAPAAPTASASGAPVAGATGKGAGSGGGAAAPVPSTGKPTGGASQGGGAGGADGDAYAYTHPCDSKNLSVRVAARPEAPGQRVIEVHNQGSHPCGLSYYPLVSLGDSHAEDRSKSVRPLVPSGLGGAPAYPVAAGQTAYAVIDLNPGGATTGTAAGIDELNVLADGDHMPNADTHNFPLGQGVKVLKPKLGLYRTNVADAVSSMAAADHQL